MPCDPPHLTPHREDLLEDLLLAAHPSVTTTARHFVTGWATRHHLPVEVADTLELLTSEVVGNAVVHGRGPVRLSIGSSRHPHGVLVRVHDTSTHQPRLQPLTPDLTGGRGLAMVELLARRWGVDRPGGPDGSDGAVVPAGDGKTVWFLLDA